MTDIEIASMSVKKDIKEIAKELGLEEDLVTCYGKDKAKINFNDVMRPMSGKLILVTSMNPTPYGEGKTTVAIGLTDAFHHIGKKAIGVLREPSMGPVFGLKGGATGGGYSQVVPMEDINLHFTGDMHAITACNDLISASIDNHIYFGNELHFKEVCFSRCLDVNDRALRHVVVSQGTPQERVDTFKITAASEIMSILTLSSDYNDLRRNLGNILVGISTEEKPIYARDLGIVGSLMTLLKDAIKPNLVQTLENNPVLIHGGPFANIAHGCNSIIATTLGLRLSDYVITEAGFGADLGAEKFFDIKCRKAQLKPDCVVLTITLKALKHHGGVAKDDILKENKEALAKGLVNLEAHLENIRKFTSHVIVCVNKFQGDTYEEIDVVKRFCEEHQVAFSINDTYVKGGVGATVLAEKIVEICDQENDFHYLYDTYSSVVEKIGTICKEIYHAGSVIYSVNAMKKLEFIKKEELSHLPICIAKTQYSFSDNPNLLGAPSGFEVTVKDMDIYSGAGFITVYLGNIMTMPGLPKNPNYEKIDLDAENKVIGLF